MCEKGEYNIDHVIDILGLMGDAVNIPEAGVGQRPRVNYFQIWNVGQCMENAKK